MEEHIEILMTVLGIYNCDIGNILALMADNCSMGNSRTTLLGCIFVGCVSHRFNIALKYFCQCMLLRFGTSWDNNVEAEK